MEPSQIATIIEQLLALIRAVFGTESDILTTVMAIFSTLAVIVGSASVIVQALEKIADVTPTTKDDLYVGKARKIISQIVAVLDRLALNPDEKAARKRKDE